MDALLASLEKQYGNSDVEYQYLPDAQVGVAATGMKYLDRDDLTVALGMKPSDGTAGYSDEEYLKVIEEFHHEMRHAEQLQGNQACAGPHAADFREDLLACHESTVYSGVSKDLTVKDPERYYGNMRENDAERTAVREMVKTLSDKSLFPDVQDPEKVVLDYLNSQCVHGPTEDRKYFLDTEKPLESLQEADSMFAQNIEKAVVTPVNGKDAAYEQGTILDSMANAGPPWPSDWATVRDVLADSKDARQQRRILAASSAIFVPGMDNLMEDSDYTRMSAESVIGYGSWPDVPESLSGTQDDLSRVIQYGLEQRQEEKAQKAAQIGARERRLPDVSNVKGDSDLNFDLGM